jgi:hypothetical protein
MNEKVSESSLPHGAEVADSISQTQPAAECLQRHFPNSPADGFDNHGDHRANCHAYIQTFDCNLCFLTAVAANYQGVRQRILINASQLAG